MATKKKVELEKVSMQGPVIVASLHGHRTVPMPTNEEEYLKLFRDNPYVYACVWVISNSGANLPLRVFKRVKGEGKSLAQPKGTPDGWEDVSEKVDEYSISRVLANPNPEQTWYDVCETTLGYMELCGRMYWELAEMVNGVPGEIYCVRPTRMTPVPAKNGQTIETYEFRVNENAVAKQIFSAEEIVPFRYFDPLSDWLGQAAIKAATEAVILDQQVNIFNRAFFVNDATPAGVLELERDISPEDFNRLTEQWKARHKGAKKSFKTAILPPGVTWKQTGIAATDMKFEALRKMNRQETLTVFGVPPVKVGLIEFAKYATHSLQDRAFFKDTMLPKMRKLEAAINKFFVPRFKGEGDFMVKFDLSDYIAEDILTQTKVNEALFKMGARSPNEIRKAMALGAPYPGGDQFYVMSQVVPVGEETVERTEKRWLAGNEQLEEIVAQVREKFDAQEADVRAIISREFDTDDMNHD